MMEIRRELEKPHVQLIILFSTLALTLITNVLFGDPHSSLSILPVIFGVMIVVEIAYFVAAEVKEGAEEHGWKHEVIDTLIALIFAVVIWYGASFILNTATPISAVVSCSMLPNLARGDFVIVQGVPPNAYEINMTRDELDSLTSSPGIISYGNTSATIDSPLYTYCLSNSMSDLCKTFRDSPESVLEKKGAFIYRYEKCGMSYTSGASLYTPCLKSVTYKGTEYLSNFSNDIIVYNPPKTDLYGRIGDIVHRTLFRINLDGKSYYITRGDNNPILDMQVYEPYSGMANHPIPQENLRGKVIGRIPFLGYFKLFLSGYFQEEAQCRTQLDFSHV